MQTDKERMEMDEFESIEPMSHEEALDLDAVELYALRELTAEQEIRFEAHYFECGDCARAVSIAQTLADAAPAKKKSWWSRFIFPVPRMVFAISALSIPATVALIAFSIFQNFSYNQRILQLSGLQPITVITAHELQMGGEDKRSVDTPSVMIESTLPVGSAYPFYRVEISGEGKKPLSRTVPAPQNSRLSLQVSSKILGHGLFHVLVYGLATQDARNAPLIHHGYFNIQESDSHDKRNP